MSGNVKIAQKLTCFHCGEDCDTESIKIEQKHFCCEGCKTVYEILNQTGLCQYYDINKNPGLTQKIKVREGKFAFLDDESVQSKLIHFTDEKQNHVLFYLPQMHCSSCIWLLEQLPKLNKGIQKSRVDFLKKEISIVYDKKLISLRKVAELITSLGYEPHISLHDIADKGIKKYDRSRIYRIGIAGFCFGNIMMLSFPDYFSFGNLENNGLKHMFNYLNLGLSLPVFFYCAGEFFISAWKSLRQNFLNIDAPIALAIVITFLRSVYEILSDTGVGYLDSMSGIVFFMLIGRFFQDKTYQNLSFDRDYTSYFPLGVTLLKEDGSEEQIPVSKLKTGQRIKIHSHEIIPADAILFLGKAQIDYSFVTGESLPVEKGIGEIIYAGGKQIGGALELEVIKDVSQSYLTQLWNNDAFEKQKGEEKKASFIHVVSKYFTYALFSIAICTALYWYFHDTSKILNAFTSILIVACPCALLLSATFTNGNMLRMLQRFGLYAKNANVIERTSDIDVIVFDKTGTLTQQEEAKIVYEGLELTAEEKQLVRSLADQSSHPLSKAVASALPFNKNLLVKNFREEKGKGIEGFVNGNKLKLGSGQFISNMNDGTEAGSKIFVSINDVPKGGFTVKNSYRSKLVEVLRGLKEHYSLALISGDNETEKQNCENYFGKEAQLLFNQQPQDKLNYIKSLQQKGRKVMMIGDGLNDAGALRQSDVGIVIADDVNNFSPSCDAILEGKSFSKLNRLLAYCKKEKYIIMGSFIISILYNIVGLFYAVQGNLQPVIAAILMPVSSISIVLFTTGMSSFFGQRLRK